MSYILLVEDDAATSRMMSLVLQTEGLTSKNAQTAEEAIELISADKPSLLILDFLVPGLDPASFIRKVRALGYDGKVLLCTAIEGEPEVGADALLRKPFSTEELVDQVKALI